MIDLEDLEGLCQGLPKESAGPLTLRARVALERRYAPGIAFDVIVDGVPLSEEIRWLKLPARVAQTQDELRVTEEGAVALALALSSRHCRWRVIRCLQSRLGEGADWLMADAEDRRIVLEVGGTDAGNLRALLSAKLDQARSSLFARHAVPAACVVRFTGPQARLESDHDHR